MKTTQLAATDACPFCRHTLDAATAGPSNPDAVPKPGDVTVCIECGAVLLFDDGLKVRGPTPEELVEILQDRSAVAMIRTIATFRAKRLGQSGKLS